MAEITKLNLIAGNKITTEQKGNDYIIGVDEELSDQVSTNVTDIKDLQSRTKTLEGLEKLEDITLDRLDEIAQSGNSARYFSIGNQIEQTWKETYDNKETSYTVPINMAHFGTYENENGDTKNGIYLEWNYTTPRGLAFCMPQSLQKFDGTDGAPNGLPAGKYCFYVGNFTNDWTNAKDIFKNKWAFFELTKAIPSGGVLCRGTIGNQAEWKIDSRTSCMNDSTLIEEVTMSVSDTQPDGYTNLGSCWGEDVGYGVLNHIECVAYGDNTWRDSDLRQWLNSDTDDWWEPLTRYNRQPAEATKLKGFLSGYSDEFKKHLKTVRSYEYTNTQKEKEGLVYTDDKIFLHSPSQRNSTTDNAEQNGMTYPEGEPWQYYKELANGETNLEGAGRFKAWTKYEILKRYALNNQSSAQVYLSRSPRRGFACGVWIVSEFGTVSIDYANSGRRCLPACVI